MAPYGRLRRTGHSRTAQVVVLSDDRVERDHALVEQRERYSRGRAACATLSGYLWVIGMHLPDICPR